MRHFFPKMSLQAIFDSFKALGLDTKRMVQVCFGAKNTQSVEWGVMVDDEVLLSLWKQAVSQDRTPHLVVRAGFASPMGSFGVIDYLVGTSPTVRDGFRMFQQYITLISATTVVEFDYCEEEQIITIKMSNRPCLPAHQLVEPWMLAMVLQRFRMVFGKYFEVDGLFLRTIDEPDPELDRLFGMSVIPDICYTGYRIPRHVWKMKMPTANATLHKALKEMAKKTYLEHFAAMPLAHAIWNTFPKALTSEQNALLSVSRHLGIAPRTLQRRLQKEVMSFRELLDYYRRQEALRLLGGASFSMAEVSYRLGYNEQSSFNRSFKRWTGTSPLQWKQKQSISLV